MNRRLAAIALPMLMLCGCQALLTSPKGTPQTSTVQLDRRPVGTPSVQLTTSPAKDSVTIHVTQRFERTDEVQTVTQQKARRYLFWPLAPLSGLTQCPVGLLASLFTSNEGILTLRQCGCMRLLALEPLRNTIDRHAITDRSTTTTESESPLAGADVLFTPDDHDRSPVRRVTLADGSATLQSESTSDDVGELLVRIDHRTLIKQRVTIAGRPDRALPTLQWPEPSIVQIEHITGSDGKARPGLQESLGALLLTHGIDVLPAQLARDAILDEQAVQLAGRVSDQSAVATGRLLRPTVLIKGTQSLDGEFLLTVITVKTGEQQEIHMKQLADLMDAFRTATPLSKDAH